MKTTEINKEALGIINTIFYKLLKDNNKEHWKNAMDFIDNKILILEATKRWNEMFIWRKVKNKINALYWKKFITNK